MSIDTERVIIEVQSHPVLWDFSNEFYKDRDAKASAWLDICKKLNENFESLSEGEKKTEVTKVQARWKSARDNFMKVRAQKKKLKSGSGAKTSKSYVFYNMLTFLDSNSSTTADESIEITQTEDNNPSENSTSADFTNEPLNFTLQSSNRKRKLTESPTAFEKELLQCVKNNSSELMDEDMNFFKSLLPSVRKLNSYKKLIFRTKVLGALIDIEKENIFTIDDLPSLNITEPQDTQNTIDLTVLNIRSQTENIDG